MNEVFMTTTFLLRIYTTQGYVDLTTDSSEEV